MVGKFGGRRAIGGSGEGGGEEIKMGEDNYLCDKALDAGGGGKLQNQLLVLPYNGVNPQDRPLLLCLFKLAGY